MRVLNLYACLGGNRKLWPTHVKVTAVEIDPEIAAIYKELFPDDEVVVGDAHEYLVQHWREFDFIWSSPPCQTHSRIRFMGSKNGRYNPVFPDMSLWQEIIFLQHHVRVPWVVENVVGYYKPLIQPTALRERHSFWSNFPIKQQASLNKAVHPIKEVTRSGERFGFTLKGRKIKKRKDQILRDLVNPDLGLYIFNCAFKEKQEVLK